MKNFTLDFIILLLVLVSACERTGDSGWSSDWHKLPDRVWAGNGLWANRLQDWKISDGKLVNCVAGPMRTVHLTTHFLNSGPGKLSATIKIGIEGGLAAGEGSSAGMLIGAGRGLDYRGAALVHHSWGPLAGIYTGLDHNGRLFIRDFETEGSYFYYSEREPVRWHEAFLMIKLEEKDNTCLAEIMAVDPFSNTVIDRCEGIELPADRVAGQLALVAHNSSVSEAATPFCFSRWRVAGSKTEYDAERAIGPIMGIQYTLSRKIVKMTVQLAPVEIEEGSGVALSFMEEGRWREHSRAEIDPLSFTAHFRATDWQETDDLPFRVEYLSGYREEASLEGVIKHDPFDKDSVTVASLSCVEQVLKADRTRWMGIDAGYYPWDEGILYPHTLLTGNLEQHKPDLLFFAGDQVYEGASPTAADRGDNASLDYLYKWYLWCQTYIALTSKIPAISIPDDHDVYHGNIWGAGGRQTPPGLSGAAAQDAGGYKMPPQFVNMVQRTQTWHLPDPVDPEAVGEGIEVYFTECNIGGVSFAVLEDRKFKPAPRELIPEADIYNGWPRNSQWNAARAPRIDTSLLGERQERFLAEWVADWSGGTWMKAVLSQTLFSNVATIPADALTDDVVPLMEIPDSGIFIGGDRVVSDFDSNGWPQSGRDDALRLFRKAFALHIAGDQHLGSTVQYGIERWRDAGYAIISPATGNIWPRRWHPPVAGLNRREGWPAALGDFRDGFGNLVTVLGVTNPHKSTVEPVRHNELSTGYSIITFNRTTRNISMANWPYYAGPATGEPFPFWPVVINQLDNYGRSAVAWLPPVTVEGIENPVFRIYNGRSGELEYAIRVSGQLFQPWVFSFGTYTIEAGEPDSGVWQRLEGINATSFRERAGSRLSF